MEIFNTKGVQFNGPFPRVVGARSQRTDVLKTTNDRHITPASKPGNSEKVAKGFASLLTEALNNVDQLDVQSQNLSARAVYDPDSVEAHEVIIASEKARFALFLTKTLADGLVRSYKELTGPR